MATLRIRRYDEPGPPEEVVIDKATAKRLKHIRTRYINNVRHFIFIDPATAEVYAQPVEGGVNAKGD